MKSQLDEHNSKFQYAVSKRFARHIEKPSNKETMLIVMDNHANTTMLCGYILSGV